MGADAQARADVLTWNAVVKVGAEVCEARARVSMRALV